MVLIEAALLLAGATQEEADGLIDILWSEGWGGAEFTEDGWISNEALDSKIYWYRHMRAKEVH
jgi:hypothetical protein